MTTQKIAILGPGLLGASIALAARRAGSGPVALWARRAAVVGELRERAIAGLVSNDLAEVVAGAGVIVLCVPIGAMPELARAIEPLIAPDALVTDVGSVKEPVVRDLAQVFRSRGRFVGSHPMAGSERTGHQAASAGLFDGRVCILTPEPDTPAQTVADARAFWEGLGAGVRLLGPAEHDQVVALVSHLPHLLAATLVNTVDEKNPAAFAFHGPGFFDTTRVAAGSPEMWAEILFSNRRAVREGAEAMIEKLREITTLLDRPQPLNEFLAHARTLRERLKAP